MAKEKQVTGGRVKTRRTGARARASRAWIFLLSVTGGAIFMAGCGGSSSPPNPPADLEGQWGGGTSEYPLSLQLSKSGGTLNFYCGEYDQLSQPLVADSQGNFDVTATQHLSAADTTPSTPSIHLTGTVSGRTMTISETTPAGKGTVYTLTYGQAAPKFGGECPG